MGRARYVLYWTHKILVYSLNVIISFDKQKSYKEKTAIFHIFSSFGPFFCQLWTLVTLSVFIGSYWNLVCWFLSLQSIFVTINVIINYQKQKSYSRKIIFWAFFSLLRGRNPPNPTWIFCQPGNFINGRHQAFRKCRF